ncbi:MAG: beta-ketodecanoyl-[acyl-carrier-protein] synthase [Pseudohongiellaceae bacterium]|jgi:beta-ketodecanoyl-[acyl-carrier-protein] synthase
MTIIFSNTGNNDMNQVVISGVGLWKPDHSISNEELVESYNAWAASDNAENQAAIDAGEISPKPFSSAEFIEKASGIKSRYAYKKEGILDITRMRPKIERRGEDQLSHQAEMALHAAKLAMESAGKTADDIDMVIVSCAYTERSYPAIAIEVQGALGIKGTGFDMLVACSAATFALQRAHDAIAAGSAKAVLVISPELTSPQVNYRDRDSHFIFGDVSTAVIIEPKDTATAANQFKILGTKSQTVFSNNIRSNFGYVSRAEDIDPFMDENLFHQNGRSVFKEVCPMAAAHLQDQIEKVGLVTTDIRRWWLHQANLNMNQLIIRRVLGRDASQDESPTVLDTFANTASAGSIIAFCLNHEDLAVGDKGVICSFGAGYSIGSLILEKCS